MAADRDRRTDDTLARQYLATLREGDPPAKAAARRGLAAIFEARDLPAEAVELLLTNAREGYRDAELFSSLARLYRQLGDEVLAAEAALESANYAQLHRADGLSDETVPLSATNPSSGTTGEDPPGVPGPSQSPIVEGRLPGPATDVNRGVRGSSALPAAASAGRPTRTVVLRGLGWIFALALVFTAATFGDHAPLAAACYTLAGLAMALLASGWQAGRRLLRVPDGPLGTGLLGFVVALMFLMGGALTPRLDGRFVTPTTPIAVPATATSRPAPTPAPPPPTPAGLLLATFTPAPLVNAQAPSPVADATLTAAAPPATPSPDPLQNLVIDPPMLVIANAGSDGVRLRAAPGSGDVLKVLQDGATVMPLPETRQESGRIWRHVHDAAGVDGWIATDFLASSTDTSPSPAPAALTTPTTPTPGSATAQRTATTGQAQPRGGACPPTHPIKGNASSMIYHVPGGAFYAKTNPEACFASEADARAAGYRRSQR